jgi:dTMP kinase
MKPLITFEGGEGAGKTTLIRSLASKLEDEGRKVLCTRAPGSLKIGAKIRDLLLHCSPEEITPKTELFLFLADRSSHVEREIKPALDAGRVVLCDRYNDSTIAYQGIARGLGKEEVEKLCDFACSGLKPKLTFYLDIDPETGLQRAIDVGEKDRIESEALGFHKKIRNAYLQIAHEHPKRIHVLDASKDKDQVLADAWKILLSSISS